jgi:hypothetical protein
MVDNPTNAYEFEDILKQSSAQSYERALQEQASITQQQQNFFAQQFIDMNVQFQSMAQQQGVLNNQIMQSYYPFTQESSLVANAAEAGIPMIAAGLAGKYAMGARGSLASGIKAAAAVGGLTYAGVTPTIEYMRGSTDSIDASAAMERLQSSGRMNAYMSMSNWAAQSGMAYSPDVFATEFEEPSRQYASMLHVTPEQLAPGVADLVSQGIVAGTGHRGRGMSEVLKEATVIFKALESFFGTVDITALRSKINEMQAAGFTPESMAHAANALQSSIFSSAPEPIRKLVTDRAIKAGNEYSDLGMAPSLGAELYVTGYESAYRQFGQMDEYNQFRFRSPSRMAAIQQEAVQNYMQEGGFFSAIGGGDTMAGLSTVVNKFDMTTPQGYRDYERYRFEQTMNMGAADVNRTITAQAQDIAKVYGVDFETGLEMILGSREAATAFMVTLKDRGERVSDIAAITRDFGGREVDMARPEYIAASAMGKITPTSLGAAAVQMAESQMRGAVDPRMLRDTSVLGGYFNPERFTMEFQSLGRSAELTAQSTLRTGAYTKELEQNIGGQAQLLSGVTRGMQSIDDAGGKLSEDVEAAITDLIWNSGARGVLLRAATAGQIVDRQTLASELQNVGASKAAALIRDASGEKLGQLYQGLQERGYSEHVRLLNQALFGGVDISGDFASMVLNTQLFTKTAPSEFSQALSKTGNALLAAGGAAYGVAGGAAITTAVLPFAAPVTGVVAAGASAVGMAASISGAAVKGTGMIYESLMGTELSVAEASQMDADAWGGELVINAIASLFVSMKSFFGSLFSYHEKDKINLITNTGNAIYGYLYNKVYIDKSNASEEVLTDEIVTLLRRDADNLGEEGYGKEIITRMTDGPDLQKLRNVVAITINYLKKEKTPIDMATFNNRFAIRAEQVAGDLTNKDVKDLNQMYQQLDRGGFLQAGKARTSGTTREQVASAQRTLGELNTELKERFGLTGSAETLSRSLANILTGTDASGQPLSEAAQAQKVKELIDAKGDTLKDGTTVKQLLSVAKDKIEGLAVNRQSQTEITEQSTRIKAVFADMVKDPEFKNSIRHIFTDMVKGTSMA